MKLADTEHVNNIIDQIFKILAKETYKLTIQDVQEVSKLNSKLIEYYKS